MIKNSHSSGGTDLGPTPLPKTFQAISFSFPRRLGKSLEGAITNLNVTNKESHQKLINKPGPSRQR